MYIQCIYNVYIYVSYTHLFSIIILHFAALCETPVDLVFALDNSGSIRWQGENNWSRILDFVEKLISRVCFIFIINYSMLIINIIPSRKYICLVILYVKVNKYAILTNLI